ncbi:MULTISPECIES: anaerobic ribonucleoside-triphosphate reductase activating protein [unclassified Paenibacillus]|uniref:anaerobic ribonucleoside-triphosphate reductase activating protein n=1 Tax=unclassified Paenibacillus TaxID=185978 RepID=UPI00240727B6|nr:MULTISPECIES: anaerobic ribonucleoside-triphosphate reductase activating protein [unclassified Paenibacillus]MDF9843447.1 anaerobic ribonucleoside-triphosphate reductase activating protein [Paenibacillus sp. PastF-2]MDF9850035.1 anaerobic ribonucleoside-triphosphate reductase activating protein [Paenibacillus sp. PastM-2]MDF9856743.1 anaerobic ribonucleoside-triphosphate reductase activating protein [Paenibacillus sp. PastF-1]MDH6482013.1 anaerobic ribonucleoside-triphosphate reductase activ
MNICGYYPESINEGEGLRAVIFLSGCRHRCPGCFNPKTWNFNFGEPFTLKRQHEIIAEMAANPLLDGLTLAGGDPFFSADEACGFLRELRTVLPDFPVWIYTGYTYEELTATPGSPEWNLLAMCQVVIDGRFVEELKDTTLPYRGSSNQRIIDIPASLAGSGVVHWQPAVP